MLFFYGRDVRGLFEAYEYEALGFISRWVGDLLGRIDRENAMKAAQLRAERANQEKSELLLRLSGDVCRPLENIGSRVGGIRLDQLDGDARRALSDIKRTNAEVLGLLQGVYDAAKIEAGQMKLMLQEIDLPVFLKSVVADMSAVADAKDLLMTLKCPGSVPGSSGATKSACVTFFQALCIAC